MNLMSKYLYQVRQISSYYKQKKKHNKFYRFANILVFVWLFIRLPANRKCLLNKEKLTVTCNYHCIFKLIFINV